MDACGVVIAGVDACGVFEPAVALVAFGVPISSFTTGVLLGYRMLDIGASECALEAV